MKSYKAILYSLSAAAMLSGCASEAPFEVPSESGKTGSLMTRCLAPRLSNPDGVEAGTRAKVPSADEFKVIITRQSKTRDAAGSVEYTYSEMPEVLTLPVGDYFVSAHHGENESSAWEAPYYYGESTFGIDANKITDDVDPIVAKLSNIRVTIVFHASLLSAMSGEANKVDVKVGNQGSMTFSPTETRSAYFRYVDQSQTLAATFDGYVDGSHVVETKSFDNVAPGNHYKITFRVHGIDDDKPGTVDGNVSVDATVEQVDMNYSVDGEGEDYFDDDMRPTQGDDDKKDPEEPTDPDNPKGPVPSAQSLEPTGDYDGFDRLDLDNVNEITDHLYCAWKVISEAEGGFKKFDVDIISTTLTPSVLSGVGLTDHLDLINPGAFEEALAGLGFPVHIGGQQEAEFDITGFLELMGALGSGDHEFRLTVVDANGTSVISIKLHN